MKKEDAYFIIALLIALVILIATYGGGKSTGFVVLEDYTNEADCVSSGYTWTNETETTCTNISNCTLCVTEDCSETCQNCTETITGGSCNNSSYTLEIYCINNGSVWTNETETTCTNISDCTLCVTEDCSETCQNCTETITGGYCSGVCDSSHLELCNETNCESSGEGYWYDNTCNSEEEPSCSNDLSLCLNETACEDIGEGYWYDEECHENECETDEQCDSDEECDNGNCVEIENETEESDTTSEETGTETSAEDSTIGGVTITPETTTPISITELTIHDISEIEAKPAQFQENVLVVKNTGTELLNSCILKSSGDFSEWINAPEEYKNIEAGEEKSFSFSLNIPENAEPKKYNLGILVECSEINQGKEFIVNVIEETFEFDLIEVKKIRDEKVKAEYTLSDLSGLDQEIGLLFKLIDNQSKEVSEISEIKNLSANLSDEFYTILEVNESVEGNLTLKVDLNSKTYSSSVQEPIVLTAPPILGFAIFDRVGDLGGVVLLISSLLALIVLILLVRKFRKNHKRKNS